MDWITLKLGNFHPFSFCLVFFQLMVYKFPQQHSHLCDITRLSQWSKMITLTKVTSLNSHFYFYVSLTANSWLHWEITEIFFNYLYFVTKRTIWHRSNLDATHLQCHVIKKKTLKVVFWSLLHSHFCYILVPVLLFYNCLGIPFSWYQFWLDPKRKKKLLKF